MGKDDWMDNFLAENPEVTESQVKGMSHEEAKESLEEPYYPKPEDYAEVLS